MFTIGVDIGGTKIKIGLLSGGHLVKEKTIETPKENVIKKLTTAIIEVAQKEYIQGIGVASAGIVDMEKGLIQRAANLPVLEGVPVKSILEETFQVPVIIGNDANCAAWAEGEIGAAQSVNSFICVTLGTGIGSGIILNGELVQGKNGYGGEVGHMTIIPNGLLCGCGRRGCWEAYASGKALEGKIAENELLSEKHYHPKELFKQYKHQSSCKIIVDHFIDYLSMGITNLQYVFDPERIVIGGGIIDSGDQWWEGFINTLKNKSSIPIDVQRARLNNNASMIGASYLAVKE
ncbi:ROK family protein [Thalassobacillus sp. CUG 92003]|uniref:ROK family protein n=1 Tax=Thalassobacillus sp. CUG 92003 TaxID=2736641 RepID=UPI0015E7541F|nr:ROK family protein [Thalassobacillus sp. CUG 92003]